MRRAGLVLLLLAPNALADRVILKGGGVLSGVIVERTDRGVVLEVGPGRIGLPASRIERVETGASALAEYRTRAAAVPSGDATAWAALGLWARAQGLETQARGAFERALLADPGNPDANRGLGRVLQGEVWLSREESYRAQGLVQFEGQWMSPDERQAALQERALRATADAARLEAEARAREAEARARAAEAAARQAQAAQAEASSGLPYWWAISGPCTIRACYGVRPSPPTHGAPSTPPPPPKPPAHDTGRTQRSERR